MFDDVENQLQNSTASHSVANSAIASDSAHTFEDAPIRSAIPAGQKVEAPPDEVAWEDDPENARNWPSKKKWIAVSIVSLYTFIPPLSSSMMAPALPQVAEKFHITNPTITALTLSSFLATFAFAPLLLAPLSEMYGRTWILHIGNILSCIFNLGCAFSPNSWCLIIFRCLCGLAGSAPFACGGGSIGDLFHERDRASAMALYTLGPLLGPALGPVAGGYIAQNIGVRYVFTIIAGISGLAALICIPCLHETYAPVIQRKQAKRRGVSETARVVHVVDGRSVGRSEYMWVNLTRAMALLCTSFICFILSLYSAFQYGVYYLMFSTFAKFFHETYGFSPGLGGLVYLGMGSGFVLGGLICLQWSDQVYDYLAQRNAGKATPEMRMPILVAGSLIVPIGLFWYGWSAQARMHWMVPVAGSAIYGCGMMLTFLPISLYLVDSFTYGASALAAAFVFRFLLGFAFPLFASQMMDGLGLGPANSLLGGLAIVLGIPFPIWIYFKGESLRKRSNVNR